MKKLKETEILELKKSTSELKEAIISMASILNKHQKGKVYFGVKDNGEAVGQDISKNTIREVSQRVLENIEPKIYPKIVKTKINKKDCLQVEFEGNDVPYFAYGRAYLRVGEENRQLSAKELEKVFLKKNKEELRWDNKYSDKSINKVNVKVLREYIERANLAKRIDYKFKDVQTTLSKLDLIKDKKLLRAGEVLFCNKNPLEVQLAIFAGTDRIKFLDIKMLKGNLFDLLEQSELYIKEHINWRVEFKDFKRVEIPEIPVDALREALVNSLCHRDYWRGEGNQIAIFKDRVEIFNPGRFPEEATPQDFIKGKEKSILRNPLIATVLYYSKDIEKWGSGIKRIYEACKRENIRVEFERLKGGFQVVFYRAKETKDLGETTQKTAQKTTQKILALIKNNPYITRGELASTLNLTEDGIKYHINNLKKAKMLKRIGPDKGGYWEVKG